MVVKYSNRWYPGLVHVDEMRIECTERTSRNRFVGPAVRDCFWYDNSDVLATIKPLAPMASNHKVLSMEE